MSEDKKTEDEVSEEKTEKAEEVSAAGESPAASASAGKEKDSGGKEKEKKAAKKSKQSARPPRRSSSAAAPTETEFEERVVAVNRVAKVVKGGRRFSFSALMIVGDRRGRVGYGLGKAKEVPEAIRKATRTAQRNMLTVPLDRGTIPHETIGLFDAGKILFKPAAAGTGVKAAGACRIIMELAGVRDILTKSLRGNNPHNIVKATFRALRKLRSVEEIATVRGKEAKGLRIN